jgi:hypothetical protein
VLKISGPTFALAKVYATVGSKIEVDFGILQFNSRVLIYYYYYLTEIQLTRGGNSVHLHTNSSQNRENGTQYQLQRNGLVVNWKVWGGSNHKAPH